MEKKLTVVKPIKGDESEVYNISALNVHLSIDTSITASFYTPTPEEWEYLLLHRTGSTVGETENARYAFVSIEGHGTGLLLFPDEYTHPSGIDIPIGINAPFAAMPITVTEYSVEEFNTLAAAGCVFLPNTGRREGRVWSADGMYYWTSRRTAQNNCTAFVVPAPRTHYDGTQFTPHWGFAVRLFDKSDDMFTVGETIDYQGQTQYTKVGIVAGNLQFKPSTNEYRLAQNAYDVIGDGNESISLTYDGWIDLFGYGTSGSWASPAQSSLDDSAYYPPDRNMAYSIDGQISQSQSGNGLSRENLIDERYVRDRQTRTLDYRHGDWGVYWSMRRSSLYGREYIYTGEEVEIQGNTYYQMTAVTSGGSPLYLRQQTFAVGTLVYDSSALLVGTLTGSVSLVNYITTEDAIYRLGDVYYRRYGNEVVQVTDIEFPSIAHPMELFDFTYDATRMGESPTITATKMWYEWIDDLWEQDVHVHFNGEKYFITLLPTTSKENTDARYKYELTFRSERNALQEVYVFDTALPYDVTTAITENTTFSFFGDINMFRKKINASLIQSKLASFKKRVDENGFEYVPDPLTKAEWNALPDDDPLRVEYHEYETYLQYAYEYVDGEFVIEGFQIVIGRDEEGNVQTSEEKLIQIQNNTVAEVLNKIKEDYELAYYIQSGTKNIVIGDCEHDFGEDNPVNYGVDRELLTVTRTNSTKKIMTRITGVGSADNIPYYYPNPTPDGWIVPLYRRNASEIDNAVQYNENDEKYLRNRIGFEYKYGKLEQTLKLGVDNTIPAPTVTININSRVGNTVSVPTSYTQPLTGSETVVALMFQLTERTILHFNDIRLDYPLSWVTGVKVYKAINPPAVATNTYENVYGNAINWGNPIYSGSYPDPRAGSYTPSANYYRKEWRTMEAGVYKIVYSILLGSGVALYELPVPEYYASDIATSSVMFAYRRTEEPKYVGEVWNSTHTRITNAHCCPMLFSTFPYMVSKYNDNTNEWEWFQHGYYNRYGVFTEFQNKAEWEQFINERGITLNPLNYRLASDVSVAVGTTVIDTPSRRNYPCNAFYDKTTRSFFVVPSGSKYYVVGRGKHRDGSDDGYYATLPVSNRQETVDYGLFFNGNPFLGYGSQSVGLRNDGYSGLTQADLHNHYFKGTIDFYSPHWFKSDTLPSHIIPSYALGYPYIDEDLLNYFGLSLQDGFEPQLFDTISFRGRKRVPYQPNLMPEVYIRTEGENRFYTAHNYDPVVEGEADWTLGEEVVDRDVEVAGHTVHQEGVANDIYHNTVDDTPSYHYVFETEWSPQTTYDHIENFDDVKATIEGMRYPELTGGRIDVAEEYAFDQYDDNSIWEEGTNGSGEYKHGYFFIKLRPLGFNLFDCALQEDMIISLKTGKCGACNFRIGVAENGKNPVQIYEQDAYRQTFDNNGNPVYTKFADAGDLCRYGEGNEWVIDSEGNTSWCYYVRNGSGFDRIDVTNARVTRNGREIENQELGSLASGRVERIEGDVITCGHFIASQQDTTDNYVWLALEKDTSTFGRLMPSAQDVYNSNMPTVLEQPYSVQDALSDDPSLTPSEAEDKADKFVILNIRMPLAYYRAAERRLAEKLVEYMYKNNYQQFDFSIDFSRIFLEQNPDFNALLNENSKMYIDFNGEKPYLQYVQHYTYKMSHDQPLPEIKVDMNPDKPVTKNLGQSLADEIIGDTPVTPTPTPIPVFPLRPRPIFDVLTPVGETPVTREAIDRTMPILGRRLPTNSGYNRITGDIISVQAGGSLNQTIRDSQELRRDMDDAVDAVSGNVSAILDMGTVIATEKLLLENTTPWETHRFRQMFPDVDYTNFDTTQGELSVTFNSDGSFHIEGEITEDATVLFIRSSEKFVTDHVYDSAFNANHFFGMCFLSDAPYDVFYPNNGQQSDNPTIEPGYTRYEGFNGLYAILGKCAVAIPHDSEQESTYVSFDVKVRIYDLTEMFGVVTSDSCVLNKLLAQEVFTKNFLTGKADVNPLLPIVDYPYTDKYIVLRQKRFIHYGAVGSLVANYNEMFPFVFPQPDYMGGWTCIKDSGDSGAATTKYDKTSGAQLIVRNIAKTELGSLVWVNADVCGETGVCAELNTHARHATTTVLSPLAKSYAIASALSATSECVFTKYDSGKSYIVIARDIAESSFMGDRIEVDGGFHYTGLEGVYAEYPLETSYTELKQK